MRVNASSREERRNGVCAGLAGPEKVRVEGDCSREMCCVAADDKLIRYMI